MLVAGTGTGGRPLWRKGSPRGSASAGYGAGSIGDYFDVDYFDDSYFGGPYFGRAATASPVPLLTSPTASSTGATTATVGVTTDTAGDPLYVVMTLSATKPTGPQIEAGQNDLGIAAAFASSATASLGINTFSATGLGSGITYYSHFVHAGAGGDSNIVTSASITTSGGAGAVSNQTLEFGGLTLASAGGAKALADDAVTYVAFTAVTSQGSGSGWSCPSGFLIRTTGTPASQHGVVLTCTTTLGSISVTINSTGTSVAGDNLANVYHVRDTTEFAAIPNYGHTNINLMSGKTTVHRPDGSRITWATNSFKQEAQGHVTAGKWLTDTYTLRDMKINIDDTSSSVRTLANPNYLFFIDADIYIPTTPSAFSVSNTPGLNVTGSLTKPFKFRGGSIYSDHSTTNRNLGQLSMMSLNGITTAFSGTDALIEFAFVDFRNGGRLLGMPNGNRTTIGVSGAKCRVIGCQFREFNIDGLIPNSSNYEILFNDFHDILIDAYEVTFSGNGHVYNASPTNFTDSTKFRLHYMGRKNGQTPAAGTFDYLFTLGGTAGPFVIYMDDTKKVHVKVKDTSGNLVVDWTSTLVWGNAPATANGDSAMRHFLISVDTTLTGNSNGWWIWDQETNTWLDQGVSTAGFTSQTLDLTSTSWTVGGTIAAAGTDNDTWLLGTCRRFAFECGATLNPASSSVQNQYVDVNYTDGRMPQALTSTAHPFTTPQIDCFGYYTNWANLGNGGPLATQVPVIDVAHPDAVQIASLKIDYDNFVVAGNFIHAGRSDSEYTHCGLQGIFLQADTPVTMTTTSITSDVMTVGARDGSVVTNPITVGDKIYGDNVGIGRTIVAQLTGAAGDTGTYSVTTGADVGSQTIYTRSSMRAQVVGNFNLSASTYGISSDRTGFIDSKIVGNTLVSSVTMEASTGTAHGGQLTATLSGAKSWDTLVADNVWRTASAISTSLNQVRNNQAIGYTTVGPPNYSTIFDGGATPDPTTIAAAIVAYNPLAAGTLDAAYPKIGALGTGYVTRLVRDTTDGRLDHPTVNSVTAGNFTAVTGATTSTLTTVGPIQVTNIDMFRFVDKTTAAISTTTTSVNGAAVWGDGATLDARVTSDVGGSVVITNWTDITTAAINVPEGDYVWIRRTSSGSGATEVTGSIHIGDATKTYSITTA